MKSYLHLLFVCAIASHIPLHGANPERTGASSSSESDSSSSDSDSSRDSGFEGYASPGEALGGFASASSALYSATGAVGSPATERTLMASLVRACASATGDMAMNYQLACLGDQTEARATRDVFRQVGRLFKAGNIPTGDLEKQYAKRRVAIEAVNRDLITKLAQIGAAKVDDAPNLIRLADQFLDMHRKRSLSKADEAALSAVLEKARSKIAPADDAKDGDSSSDDD